MLNTSHKRNANQNYNEIAPHTGHNGHHQKSLQTINAGERVKKRECSCTVGENANRYSYYGEHYGYSLKKLGIKLPYGPAIPLLGIYSEKTTILKDTCTLMFIVALSTIARTWKQPRCPSADE